MRSGWVLLVLLCVCMGAASILIFQNWQTVVLQFLAWRIAGPAAAFFILVGAGGAFLSALWFAGRYVAFAKILKEAAPVMQVLDRKVKEQSARINELETQLRRTRPDPPAPSPPDQGADR